MPLNKFLEKKWKKLQIFLKLKDVKILTNKCNIKSLIYSEKQPVNLIL